MWEGREGWGIIQESFVWRAQDGAEASLLMGAWGECILEERESAPAQAPGSPARSPAQPLLPAAFPGCRVLLFSISVAVRRK